MHRNVIGADTQEAIAAIRGEVCAVDSVPAGSPRPAPTKTSADSATPILPTDIFPIVTRLIGADAFRAVWSDFSRVGPDWLAAGRGFADFLREHRAGRDLPVLADIAVLELARHQVQRATDLPSIGACCLPANLLTQHLDLRLRLQPGWHYVTLGHAVQDLPQDRLDLAALQRLSIEQVTYLRLMPGEGRSDHQLLALADYAFETSLARHLTLAVAIEAARQVEAGYDGIRALGHLIDAGGVVDVLLHPQTPPMAQS
ncbi:MAG TPA: hypothetical protein VM659_25320 [Dongiaceae bacterium]|nr:hypothetical protein [Dongiaceae bacterium]